MESQDAGSQPGGSLNPQALSAADLARVLSASGRKAVSEEMVERCLAEGAPTNPDGTISLVRFAAFLAKEVTRGRTD
ncbi:MAG: hypothetical protein GXX96_31435 [Planctomycetaceae bacterium]|jgi:hypothetical protein|nr:hypothetical protein [Planctomycetaceae bacterium]